MDSSRFKTRASGQTKQKMRARTIDHVTPGRKKGLAGARCVESMQEAAAMMEKLPEFCFVYVAPRAKPKLIVFHGCRWMPLVAQR